MNFKATYSHCKTWSFLPLRVSSAFPIVSRRNWYHSRNGYLPSQRDHMVSLKKFALNQCKVREEIALIQKKLVHFQKNQVRQREYVRNAFENFLWTIGKDAELFTAAWLTEHIRTTEKVPVADDAYKTTIMVDKKGFLVPKLKGTPVEIEIDVYGRYPVHAMAEMKWMLTTETGASRAHLLEKVRKFVRKVHYIHDATGDIPKVYFCCAKLDPELVIPVKSILAPVNGILVARCGQLKESFF